MDQIPPEICALRDTENFKPIKDEIRRTVGESGVSAFRGDPRVNVRNGWAWFDLKDYDDALATHEILQGHFWSSEGITLECRVYKGHGLVQLLGPVEDAIGLPPSLLRIPVSHKHSGGTVSGKSQVAGHRHGHAGSNDHAHGDTNVQSPLGDAPRGLDQSIQTPIILPTGYAGVGYPQRRRQSTGPLSPITTRSIFSSSSRSSSISTQSTMMIPAYIANPGAHDRHLGSWNPSLSSVSVTSTTPRSSGPVSTPPQSISEYDSEPPSPSAVNGHKITIRNLGPDTARESVYALVEEKTHAFVGLVQPDYITLRQFHGQFHAYVKFIREKDAKKAAQQLHGCKFMGRTLQATLG